MAEKGKKTAVKWWIKLPCHWFRQIHMEKMYLVENAESRKAIQLIYIKLLLVTVRYDGILSFQHEFPTLAEELAFTLKEKVEDVELTLKYLTENNLMEKVDDDLYYLTEVPALTDTESEGAERKRKQRERERAEKLLLARDESVTSHDKSLTVTSGHAIQSQSQNESQSQSERENQIKELLSAHDVNFDDVWLEIQNRYPNKRNLKDALGKFLEMLDAENVEKTKETIRQIIDGISIYLYDYKTKNDDDPNMRFVPQFSRWLEKDASYWMTRARKARNNKADGNTEAGEH